MWTKAARIILKNRWTLLGAVLAASGFMAWKGGEARVSYKFSRILPLTDSTHLVYEDFKKTYGDVGNVVVVGVATERLFESRNLNLWRSFSDSLSHIEGVESVMGITSYYDLEKGEDQKLRLVNVRPERPYNTRSALEARNELDRRPFYKGLLMDAQGRTTLLMVQIRKEDLYTSDVLRIVESIKKRSRVFEKTTGLDVHLSGLPYIRMANVLKIQREVYLFIGLALGVTALLMYLFLKSFRAMLISMFVVVLGVVWSFGLIGLFGFEVTILSSIIPPLIIVIGVPNCIFLINKYHQEFKQHGNQILALQRTIIKVGNATLMTNTTTALGFASFTLTQSVILREFGLVACLNVLVVFVLSIIVIPIVYTFISPPLSRHYQHFERNWVRGMNRWLIQVVTERRVLVYVLSAGILVLGYFGIQRMEVTGNLSDDFQRHDPVFKDLKFFEAHYRGVVPLEIDVRSEREGGMKSMASMRTMEHFQRALDTFPELSRSLSAADLLKFARQGFYNGDPAFYGLPNELDRDWVLSALPQGEWNQGALPGILDSTGTRARISLQVADIGTPEMTILQSKIEQTLEAFFPKERYHTEITGASVVFLKGTRYLIKNLILSLLLAIAVIATLMAFLFRSARMIVISLIPNLVPLVLTAAIMGYAGIPLKPSTILVFSIAFGISVDDTIHFLAKYRQELQRTQWNMQASILNTIRETSVSMLYTSIVLFFGFAIFIASEFGGTQALGLLVGITLFIAMISNLILLPTLLMSLEKLITARSFATPTIELNVKDGGSEIEPAE
ncbi:MMPL family transporter [bacterium]|nr:MMPL family transporter [bacterium]